MIMKQFKPCANFAQDYTDAEKAQARANIGAASTSVVTHTSNGLMSAADKLKLDTLGIQVQSDWNQNDVTAVDFIRNKPTIRTYKTYATSYDYPDCMHVRTPGANTSVIVYFPYEDRKKVQFVDDHVYNLKISTSGVQPQDSTIETITAKLFTLDTDRQRKYLCPSYTFKAGSSAQFDLNWKASGVLSLSEAFLDECAPHIEFDCILKTDTDIAIYCNGLEWHLNVLSSN